VRPATASTAEGAADGAPGSAGAQPKHKRELTQQERAFVRALNTVRARSGAVPRARSGTPQNALVPAARAKRWATVA
jgi:hypothetical protein